MSIEYGVKTNKRPNLVKDLVPGDILQVGSEEHGDVFKVVKINNKEYLFQQKNTEAAYANTEAAYAFSRGVMNQKIMDFDGLYDAYYIVTHEDLEQ
jgi:hypothetical protein